VLLLTFISSLIQFIRHLQVPIAGQFDGHCSSRNEQDLGAGQLLGWFCYLEKHPCIHSLGSGEKGPFMKGLYFHNQWLACILEREGCKPAVILKCNALQRNPYLPCNKVILNSTIKWVIHFHPLGWRVVGWV